jgi:hypothetical protein
MNPRLRRGGVESWAYVGEAFNKRHPVRSGAVNPRLKTHTQSSADFSTSGTPGKALAYLAKAGFSRFYARADGICPGGKALWRKG